MFAKSHRRLLSLMLLAVAALLNLANVLSADETSRTTPLSKIMPDQPWPERRKEIKRRWLDLLGDFPQKVPELKPEMKEVDRKHGITRYHVTFQSESDDRVTAWLLVPEAAREKPTPAIVCVHSLCQLE